MAVAKIVADLRKYPVTQVSDPGSSLDSASAGMTAKRPLGCALRIFCVVRPCGHDFLKAL